jgi:hypothetical protein
MLASRLCLARRIGRAVPAVASERGFSADINPALAATLTVQDYVAGLEYRNGALEAI